MKLTKVLAGLLLALAIVLAVVAWMMSRSAPRQVAPVPKPVATAFTDAPSSQRDAPLIQYVVAAQAIPAGRTLAANDLKVESQSSSLSGAFSEVDALIGKTVMVEIPAGQAIMEQQLVAGLSLQLGQGERAVAVAVKEALAAGNHVRPGDFVDVFFTLQEDGREATFDSQSRLLLARSRVLAYGSNTVENPPLTVAQRKAQAEKENAGVTGGKANSRDEARGRPEAVNTAVLAVPLEDVQRLTLAEKFGQLNLALRHPDDLALPDPALFATLPPALQPVGLQAGAFNAMSPADKAFAGLRFKDLVTGGAGKSSPVRSTSVAMPKAGSVRTTTKTSAETVEVHNGTSIQTVSY